MKVVIEAEPTRDQLKKKTRLRRELSEEIVIPLKEDTAPLYIDRVCPPTVYRSAPFRKCPFPYRNTLSMHLLSRNTSLSTRMALSISPR